MSYNINGKVSSSSTAFGYGEGLVVNAKCFNGILGLTTCKATNLDNVAAFDQYLPYYYNFNSRGSVPYCVECCGNSPERIDKWQLQCSLDSVSARLTNMYGYEFRFLKRSLGSADVSELVSCPIWRTGCTYASNGTVIACQKNDGKFLSGYTLTLNIREYNSNFQFWRGVDSCTVVTTESNTTLAHNGIFSENIDLVYNNDIADFQIGNPQLFIISIFILVIICAALYFLRKRTCEVCQRKLVICFRRCTVCRILGAKADPDLIRMLAEKGAILQGTDKYKVLRVQTIPVTVNPWKHRVLPLVQDTNDNSEAAAVVGGGSFLDKALKALHAPDDQSVESALTKKVKAVPRGIVLKAIAHPSALPL